MSDPTLDAEVVTARKEVADSSRALGARRKREPSATKLRAAALYASGREKTLKGAIVAAGGSEKGVARVPGPKGWGSVELVRTDLEYNPQPTTPRAMYQDGLATLHGLALKGESESVRGGSADRLVNHLKELVTSEDPNANGLRQAELYTEAVAWLLILGARVGARLGPRAVELLEDRRGLLPAPDKITEAMRPKSAGAALDDALSIYKGTERCSPRSPVLGAQARPATDSRARPEESYVARRDPPKDPRED